MQVDDRAPIRPEKNRWPRRLAIGGGLAAVMATLLLFLTPHVVVWWFGRYGNPEYEGPLHPARPQMVPCAPGEPVKVGAPTHGIYTAVWNNFMAMTAVGVPPKRARHHVDQWNELVGKRAAVVTVSDSELTFRFPSEHARQVWAAGAVPLVVLTPMSGWDALSGPDDKYTMQGFIDGTFDDEIRAAAREARSLPFPVMVSFGGEVNAGWAWSG